ncbi:hypothetical protein FRC01_007305, partial [Tulasnella sp. 417]
FGIIFQARTELEPAQFFVSQKGGLAAIRPDGFLDVPVMRIAQNEPEFYNGTWDRLVIHWRLLLMAEVPLLHGARHSTLKKLWDAASERVNGSFTIPIELFNPSLTKRPFVTWKDERKWTKFTYRPGVKDTSAKFRPYNSMATATGAFGSVWKCAMKLKGDDTVYRIALKEITLSQAAMQAPVNRDRILRRANQELEIWKELDHENVGLIIGWNIESIIYFMLPWYPNGDVLSFSQSERQKALPRPQQRLARWQLIVDITKGLNYLHSKNVIHGDLRHDQVLVDEDGRAKIVDFGLAKVIEEGVDNKITTSVRFKGRYEYMAPELLLQTPPRRKATDVYSYALVILEVAASRHAFDGLPAGPAEVVRNMVAKTHLPKPERFKPALQEQSKFWTIFHFCTVMEWDKRPAMWMVLREITAIASPLETIFNPQTSGVISHQKE